jgi:hypothetical protein
MFQYVQILINFYYFNSINKCVVLYAMNKKYNKKANFRISPLFCQWIGNFFYIKLSEIFVRAWEVWERVTRRPPAVFQTKYR